ncbi:MAG: hypothetical protein KU37_03970 [Sulfuricurvum sp. PC08-66]|uniref:Uncharacterized protein n=1 Tax=Sulfuricurvum sp. PC08-66 TaxID=1539066 RepID=A0ACD6B9W3_9BACT|nr:MAG: hypothetical protein KU37_03970 [Sulfuricurvum sp. PC08-66]8D49_A Chain A, OrfB_Zn_ribbon domain-containing protein [Sulfuricurvum sp. PC08-66]8D4A_A Chain A, OrfB_Zn_ribbon domain-containing protein [Sulfuricurvum sp. PC08-66]8D4B_A Chain A, OrfB_Zn_ribbon domain-containing protein [Sulfuricurvum sp. PC08-66]
MLHAFTNQYQLSKTLRFGATLKEDEKKCKSHEELKGFVDISYENMKSSATIAESLNENELVKKCERCYSEIVKFHNAWEKIYYRTDQIAVYKDFYRQLSRKARFDAGKQNSQLITLASLCGMYQGAKLSRYITNYWKDNITRQKSFLKDFSQQLHQYTRALEKSDKAHTKPNLINFNKTFMVLANLVNEIVIPLSNGAISFPNISKLEDGEESHLIEFALNDYSQLSELIGELKDAIATNGGYTPFAKVTLNHYTAEQKPHVFKNDIDAKIRELKLIGLVETLKGKSSEQIEEYFSNLDKFSTYNDRNQSVIVRTQCFKYKPIPFLVKHQLAKYISEPNGWDEDAVAKVLDAVGAIRSPAHDYANNQEGFDLNHYPIKVAFDYAWEQLANSLYTTVTFPQEMCEKYLNSIYGCEVSKEPVFKFYADLLYIRKNLAVLEHKNNLPSNQEEFICKINNTFENIVLPYKISQFETYKKDILAWINDGHDHKKYTDAKQQLGFIRGGLKGRIKAEEVSQKDKYGKIKSYYENPYTKLTNEFKQISSTYGKTFAELRDKFKEKNEITKITHFGIIIEDKNRDRYLLASELKHEQINHVSTILNKLDKSSEFITYQVKSLTSKTLIKLIKNHTTKKGAISPYADFHTSKTGFNKNEIEKNWDNYKREQVLVEYVKDCLTDSTMAKNQNWAEFGWNFEKCNSYEDIEHEIDQKSYLLQSDTISKQSIASLVEGGCLLLPIINQDITSKERKDKNQFSKDWNHIFEGSKEFRLHPEFAVSYRTPIEGYPVQKRYGRLQFVCAFNAHIVPQNGEFINLKKQIENFNDEDVQKRNVTEFNKKVNHALSDKEYVVIGIDRGLKQLATLCVLDKRGKILGDFEIYKKEFVRAEKRSESHWEHTQAETRHILDLSNLRVETTIEGKKVLVDQSLTLVKKNRDTPDEEATEENKQKIKLKQLSYIRKLQHKMQTNEQDVLDLINNEPSDEEFKKRIEGLISSFGEGQKYADLPINTMREMISDLQGVIARGNNQTEKNKIIELDAADNLKQGIVANMIGIVNYIFAKYSYKAYISLEDLSRAYGGAKSGYDGRYLPSTSQDEDVDFKEQQNQMLAGLGTYQFFEMQLLKKLQKIQSDNTVLRFVPAFRSADNYRNILRLEETKYKSKPFGVVHFIDPKFTSKKCPVCSKTNVYRDKDDILVCKECGFRSDSQLKERENNIHYIHNGDDNGAYHIALKSVENLIQMK